jgi:uncharacterized protein YuzE
MMHVQYDDEFDILYIRLRDETLGLSEYLEEGVTEDVDENGAVIGIEILDANERLDREAVTQLAAAMRSTAAA